LKWMPALAKAEFEHNNFTEEKTARRLASKTERKDILRWVAVQLFQTPRLLTTMKLCCQKY